MSHPSIRRASTEDAAAIANVQERSWEATYRGLMPDAYLDRRLVEHERRIQRWRVSLADISHGHRCYVTQREGAVIGFASCGPSRDSDATERTGEILAIYLLPQFLGVGLGRGLFARAVGDLRDRGFNELTLWVLDGNVRALRFYEAAGWSADGACKVLEADGTSLDEIRYRAPSDFSHQQP